MQQQTTLTEQDWDTIYMPVSNQFQKDTQLFETYGEEAEFIFSVPEEHVWTMVDGDDGGVYIVNGRHYVNRIGYYFCLTPHDPNSSIEICVGAPSCKEHQWVKVESKHVASGVDPEGLGNVCEQCDILESELEDDDE